jgi:hypothetical protein
MCYQISKYSIKSLKSWQELRTQINQCPERGKFAYMWNTINDESDISSQ